MKRRVLRTFILGFSLMIAMSVAVFASSLTTPHDSSTPGTAYNLVSYKGDESYNFTFTGTTDYGINTSKYPDTRLVVRNLFKRADGERYTVFDLREFDTLADFQKLGTTDSPSTMTWDAAVIFSKMPEDGILGYLTYTGTAFKTSEHTVTVETFPYIYYAPFDIWVAASEKTYYESAGNILSSDNKVNRIPIRVSQMVNDGLSAYDPRTDKLMVLYSIIVSDKNGEVASHGNFAIEMLPGTYLGYSPSDTDKTSDWATENVKNLWFKDLIPSGVVADLKVNITRAEFTTIITKAWEYSIGKELTSKVTSFKDIDANEYKDYIERGYDLEIILGRNAETFDPDGYITRQEAAIIISRLVELKTDLKVDTSAVPTYSDTSQISDWAKAYVAFTLENEIILGTGNNMFSPKSNMTREQGIVMIDRVFTQYGW